MAEAAPTAEAPTASEAAPAAETVAVAPADDVAPEATTAPEAPTDIADAVQAYEEANPTPEGTDSTDTSADEASSSEPDQTADADGGAA
jgi:hypothetical protein